MISEQYNESCRPARWKILGLRMQRFSVGHAQLLEQIGYDCACVTPPELLTAVRACSLPLHKAERYLERGGSRLWHAAALWFFKKRRALFESSARKFQRYLDESKSEVRYFADSKRTRKGTCPPILMVKRDLMHYYGYSEVEVLRMPFAKAEIERLAVFEADGSLDFRTAEDDDLEEQARKMAKQHAEEEAAKNGTR